MRRSIRLRGFDYTGPATYLVTIVAQSRAPLFGVVLNRRMVLSPAGRVVRSEWLRSAELREEVLLDVFVVMPDHFHGIVTFHPASTHSQPHLDRTLHRPRRSLGSLIAQFKASSTRKILEQSAGRGLPPFGVHSGRIWQRSFYESVLRSPDAIERARWYVGANPRRWRGPAPLNAKMG
ncbi:MAG TPA: hypothetical protein PK948_10375 [Gemmatimonadales bacterium]|jgi:putative transposase|nr:hypothetical protein [Gemmatimonadales bacterium]